MTIFNDFRPFWGAMAVLAPLDPPAGGGGSTEKNDGKPNPKMARYKYPLSVMLVYAIMPTSPLIHVSAPISAILFLAT